MSSQRLRITTKDNFVIETDYQNLRLSELCRTIMEGKEEEELVEIPLPNVEKSILDKIIEFGKHYRSHPMDKIPKPLPLVPFSEIVDPWYASFITQFEVIEGLYPLLKAVNYMDVPPLQELACARIASLIRGKEPDEIRKILGIWEEEKESDFFV